MHEKKSVKEQITKQVQNCQISGVFSPYEPSMIELFYKNSQNF